ncbi:glycolate oxidase [Aspergillus steynii IBT 23096]|uniref:Glycolate oxidase n=1 Tax=Aspergillus steynii IBT 23096 TaxID=1392250 RepID=A0A2I2G615_9EURO|nr:glycolate oxidase [Aspergillus steynii IBT 23096]PLB48309.1 glycolate oxidase [Aspergillus steynii IBT 23096]
MSPSAFPVPKEPSELVPLLTESHHSGIPIRLASAAENAKSHYKSNSTVSGITPRDEDLPTLPPGIERAQFNVAITDLESLVGSENVELNTQPLNDGWYMEHPNTHDAFHLLDPTNTVSSAAVYPSSTEEVSAVVKWANHHEIPLWPISIGRNLGYGGAAPRVRGSVVVDLGRRMNEVLKIDSVQLCCLVEPGVSYFKLYEEVQKSGYPLWIDTPDIGGGSVLGNAVDRGMGYTPMADHFANHCGLEVVLPNGNVLRTGMGALPGPNGQDNPTWQAFQYGYGPYIDGIFTQSNFGIVTKMGMWLMPETDHLTFVVAFPEEEDLPEIIETVRQLMAKEIIQGSPQLRHVIQELTATGINRDELYPGDGQVPSDVIRLHASTLPCGDCSWVLYATLYGTPSQIQSDLTTAKSAFAQCPGSRVLLPCDLPKSHYIHSCANVSSGVPEIRGLECLNWKHNGAHLFFSPICPPKGDDIRTIYGIVSRIHRDHGLDIFPTFCVALREIHLIINIIYDRASLSEKQRAETVMTRMIDECAAAGYGDYRTHILFADQVAGAYSWNNHVLLKFHENMKDMLDEKGILAPGRNGIWPRKYREGLIANGFRS